MSKIIYILFSIIALELFLKFIIGLGQEPLYIESKDFEYIYAPNQDVYRFHNHIFTNKYSMRNKELSNKDKIRILGFGDSVINGGAHLDNDELVTSILEKKLQNINKEKIRVLNIGANSWGPDNAFAYLKKHGDFNAKMIFLIFSSHDWHDNMHHRKVVGKHYLWPNKQPLCALTDLMRKYIIPKIKENSYSYLNGFDDSKVNSGWKNFVNYSKKNKIPLLVYVHATQKEIKNKEYNKNGKSIINFLIKNKTPYVTDIKIMKKEDYIDNIHLNSSGHKKMAEILYPYVKSLLHYVD